MVRIVEGYDGGSSDQNIVGDSIVYGNVFTLGTTGEDRDYVLENASVNVKKIGTPPGALILDLWTTDGANPLQPQELIASAEILEANVGAAYVYLISSDWDRKPTIRAGSSYAITVRTEGADGGNYYIVEYDTTGSYAGGEEVISNDAGISWTNDAGDDMNFRIYGSAWDSVSADYSTILDKGGKEADSNIQNVVSVNGFVKNSEASINTRARFDFTGEWSNLKDSFKGIISEQVENIAATRIINFDINSYTERLIAKLMVDTLTEEFERVLMDLKDKQVQKDMVA